MPAVDYQEHRWVGKVVLGGEESFRSVVGFHEVHVAAFGQAPVFLAVWPESYSSMEEHLEVWPYLAEASGSFEAENVLDDGQEPARHARYVGYVVVQGRLCKSRELRFPVGH